MPPRESPTAWTPQAEYEARLARRRELRNLLGRRERWVSNARLVVFAGVGACVIAAAVGALPWWVSAFPCGVFVLAVVWHDRILDRSRRAAAALRFYEDALARIDYAPRPQAPGGESYAPPDHPYARDLDLFGAGSLFSRLCIARTLSGEVALASWLLAPAPLEEARERQGAAAELRDALDLREALALEATEARPALHPEVLRAWGEAPAHIGTAVEARWLPAIWLVTAAVPISVALWATTAAGPFPLLGVALLSGIIHRLFHHRLDAITQAVNQPERELLILARVTARIEGARVNAPWLRRTRAVLGDGSQRASVAIHALDRLVNLLDAMRNAFFAPLGFLLLWRVHACFAIERWRRRFGPKIGPWLEAIGAFEAVSSVASFSYENPGFPFPVLDAEGPRFQARNLGHPLIPPGARVCNDLSLGLGEPRAFIVSGSNMSGKSTLLRTAGINTALAMAGAPVCADALSISPLQLGATIRVQDSLQEGRSRFYSEIQRLKALVDLAAGERPLFFLLDEILHGTNSHDRTQGAKALVAQLVARGAIGLVTTHDLAICAIARESGLGIGNVHFVDDFQSGELHFDYRLREGVVEKSNALELMRSVGLEV